MAEEIPDTMNLDLNLGPDPEPASASVPSEAMNLDEWVDDPVERIRAAVRVRARQRRRWRQLQMSREPQNFSVDLNQLIGTIGDASPLQAGEGSVAAEERTDEVPKMCENNNGFLQDEMSNKKDDVGKGNGGDGSFFDCNICLDLATDPVVTCCGHLFCWPCLYQWLHVHSDAKECPVCKGEVTMKHVTPIYGRGSTVKEPEDDSSVDIPHRPCARRVESLRQTTLRNPFSFPMEEMIRRLGRRLELTRDLSPPQDSNGARESADRTNSFLNRIMTLRGMRAEEGPIPPPEDIVDLTETSTVTPPEAGPARRLHSLLLRRLPHFPRSSTSVLSAANSTERLVNSFSSNHPPIRNQEQAQPVDDRDSFSSIAAVINSESQMDTAAEIDSMVSLSTSSSRRRTDASRVSDVDSGDSRAPRRRRLN